jgi:hypothetical protein
MSNKNYSEVAINGNGGVTGFGMIYGCSTLFPAFFQPLAAFSGRSHVRDCLIWTSRGREGLFEMIVGGRQAAGDK